MTLVWITHKLRNRLLRPKTTKSLARTNGNTDRYLRGDAVVTPHRGGHAPARAGESQEQAFDDQSMNDVKQLNLGLIMLGHWDANLPNPVFREPGDWRTRHLRFYDSDYQMLQPE